MKYIMRVEDIQTLSNGLRAIAGVNPSLDGSTLRHIQEIIGTNVLVRCSYGDLQVVVKDVSCSTALTGRKNIFILVEDATDSICIGCEVYTDEG